MPQAQLFKKEKKKDDLIMLSGISTTTWKMEVSGSI